MTTQNALLRDACEVIDGLGLCAVHKMAAHLMATFDAATRCDEREDPEPPPFVFIVKPWAVVGDWLADGCHLCPRSRS